MFRIMTALHLLFAIFTIGPLAHATMTAARGLRRGDAAATHASARMTRVYGLASVLTIVFGFALMSATSPFTHKAVAQFGETWIWLSLLLWVVTMVLAFAVIAPLLDKATEELAASRPGQAITLQISASGGLVALIFVAIVFLMVYQPGG